jgi:hypothetical protein
LKRKDSLAGHWPLFGLQNHPRAHRSWHHHNEQREQEQELQREQQWTGKKEYEASKRK